MSSPWTGAFAALALLAPSWVFAQIDPLPTVFWFRAELPTVVVVHREIPEGGAVVQKLGLPPEESRLAAFAFDPAYTAVDARPVNDLDGLGKKAIALLASDDAEVRPMIEARSLRGKRLRNIRFSKGHQPVALDILPNQNGNQAEEALVLARQTAYDRPRLLIRDLATKERINAISLPKIFEPLDVAVIPDVSGNGFDEALVLAARKSDGRDFLLVWDTGDTGKIVHIKLKPGFTAIDHGYYQSSWRGDLVVALVRKSTGIARRWFFDPLASSP
jgi:hypothetical protein